MVDPWATSPLLVQVLALADAQDRTLLSRLPAPQRAKLLMALLALVLVGLTLIVLVAMGARWYRRSNNVRVTGHKPEAQDAWANAPLNTVGKVNDKNDERGPHDDE
jgi:hypothetical protein